LPGRHPRAVIFGCAGTTLAADERHFFADADPHGFILFKRNVADPEQVHALVAELRATVARTDAPVLIDQEGGRVARLGPPHWPVLPLARAIGLLAEHFPPIRRWSVFWPVPSAPGCAMPA
jgi:beta-N-acetylhexosaminidase